ncbi:restriction endonuclease subunit S [Escherichia marmotae]|uniref:Type-1 restriction enzyme EcoKI specificity protein n=1 Tax=Escherichia marmotae TaxID=1499973 RepID=A0A370V9F0_9ESCH|nr:restriction endonuclease subunit S [Escherichia marmotae]MEC9644258.1 restriction endonuclease subunit S [Escherichia marmotae]MED0342106.1 restriction endonuclease subunit S [Escherichia marmotae]MED0546962.1 restriction endonuclease subunit S [Escherichia marmotae]RDR27961.1 Type-1 restriction enzyme EcoKI specificity protein [Escherichia marmotae]RDR33025.1 Type-1 restriction enzyme EcoKI specificity protein [Escherichia marmotae]
MSEKTRPESWLSKIAIDCFDQISTTNNKVKSTACSPHGLYPVIDQGQNYISGYINDESKLIKITTPICIFGDHTRIIKWVEHNFVPGADGTKLLKPKDFIYPRYAYYSLCALNIPDKGYSRHFKYFKELKIDIPAWEEQKIIAEKLDTLLAQVESTKARLEQIPQILKRFRQAVLAAAVSGNLTEAWRRKNNFNFDNWENLTLGHIVKKIEAGKNLKCIEIPPDNHQYGIIKISAVTWGEYDEEESKTLPDNSLFIESRRISIGDFLISRANTLELLGNPVIVKQVTKNLMLSDKVLRLVMEDYDKPWINIFLRSFYGRREIKFRSTGNQLSMRNIGQKALLEIPIPKPPIEEQAEIVRRVEQLFAYADTIEKQVNNALARVNNLTQSILAKAFRGELTAQWRAENPELISGENSAAALLEKIKAERAASGGKKASRKKS